MQQPLTEQQHCARQCVRGWEYGGDSLQVQLMVLRKPNKSSITMQSAKDQIKCYVMRTSEDSRLQGSREGFPTLSFLWGWQGRAGAVRGHQRRLPGASNAEDYKYLCRSWAGEEGERTFQILKITDISSIHMLHKQELGISEARNSRKLQINKTWSLLRGHTLFTGADGQRKALKMQYG